jgi:hypothetical protein
VISYRRDPAASTRLLSSIAPRIDRRPELLETRLEKTLGLFVVRAVSVAAIDEDFVTCPKD